MAIKAFSGNVPPSKVVGGLIFPSKTSDLDTRVYEDNDFEEVSKSRFLVGTADVIYVDEVSKWREGIPGWEATPTESNLHSADGSPMPRANCSQALSTSSQTPSEVCVGLHKMVMASQVAAAPSKQLNKERTSHTTLYH